MRAVRPRTKPQDVRRDELLASGERLFLEKGVAATSIDEIAAGADVAKGTVYLYFPSKEDLLAALRGRFADRHRETVAARVAQEKASDWPARLGAWVAGSIGFYLDHVALHDALFHAREHHPKRRMSLGDSSVVEGLGELLGDGTKAGAWSVEDPVFTAMLLFNALHGAVDHALTRGTPVDRARLVAAVTSHFLAAAQSAKHLSKTPRRV